MNLPAKTFNTETHGNVKLFVEFQNGCEFDPDCYILKAKYQLDAVEVTRNICTVDDNSIIDGSVESTINKMDCESVSNLLNQSGANEFIDKTIQAIREC